MEPRSPRAMRRATRPMLTGWVMAVMHASERGRRVVEDPELLERWHGRSRSARRQRGAVVGERVDRAERQLDRPTGGGETVPGSAVRSGDLALQHHDVAGGVAGSARRCAGRAPRRAGPRSGGARARTARVLVPRFVVVRRIGTESSITPSRSWRFSSATCRSTCSRRACTVVSVVIVTPAFRSGMAPLAPCPSGSTDVKLPMLVHRGGRPARALQAGRAHRQQC